MFVSPSFSLLLSGSKYLSRGLNKFFNNFSINELCRCTKSASYLKQIVTIHKVSCIKYLNFICTECVDTRVSFSVWLILKIYYSIFIYFITNVQEFILFYYLYHYNTNKNVKTPLPWHNNTCRDV